MSCSRKLIAKQTLSVIPIFLFNLAGVYMRRGEEIKKPKPKAKLKKKKGGGQIKNISNM